MSDKGIDYNFGNNKEIYIQVTKYNDFLAKVLSYYDWIDFVQILSKFFHNFQNVKSYH